MKQKLSKEEIDEIIQTVDPLLQEFNPISAMGPLGKPIWFPISAGTLHNFCSAGIGPRKMKIGRKSFIKKSDLLEWLENYLSRNLGARHA